MTTSIYLNIYDLTSLNKFLDCFGLGAYHSAIQIFDTEFSFGAHPYEHTGVIENQPNSNKLIQFRKTILLGNTSLKLNEISKILSDVKSKYIGNTYDVFKNNCNHFSNELCIKLMNKPIPKYINRLSNFSSLFRCLFSSKLIYGDALQNNTSLKKISIGKSSSSYLESQKMIESNFSKECNVFKTEVHKSETIGEIRVNESNNGDFEKQKIFNDVPSNL